MYARKRPVCSSSMSDCSTNRGANGQASAEVAIGCEKRGHGKVRHGGARLRVPRTGHSCLRGPHWQIRRKPSAECKRAGSVQGRRGEARVMCVCGCDSAYRERITSCRPSQVKVGSAKLSPSPSIWKVLSGPAECSGCRLTQKDFAFSSTSPLYMSTTFTLYPCSSTCTRPKTVHGCTLMRYDQCDDPLESFQDSLLCTPAHAPSRSSAGGGGGRTAEHSVRASQGSAKVCCLHSAALRIAARLPAQRGGRKHAKTAANITAIIEKSRSHGAQKNVCHVASCLRHRLPRALPAPRPPFPPPRQAGSTARS